MTQFHALDDDTLVSGQIRAEDVAGAAAAGVTLIVNNRPDGEETGQPRGAEIAAAAEAAGLAYRHIPVQGGVSAAQVEAMAEAFDQAGGKVLIFCRSGTRSTYLWALARARRGADGEILVGQAAAAGHDIGPIRAYL